MFSLVSEGGKFQFPSGSCRHAVLPFFKVLVRQLYIFKICRNRNLKHLFPRNLDRKTETFLPLSRFEVSKNKYRSSTILSTKFSQHLSEQVHQIVCVCVRVCVCVCKMPTLLTFSTCLSCILNHDLTMQLFFLMHTFQKQFCGSIALGLHFIIILGFCFSESLQKFFFSCLISIPRDFYSLDF